MLDGTFYEMKTKNVLYVNSVIIIYLLLRMVNSIAIDMLQHNMFRLCEVIVRCFHYTGI
jgi:hypothetical protein